MQADGEKQAEIQAEIQAERDAETSWSMMSGVAICARPYGELQSLQTPRTKDVPKHWSMDSFLARSATHEFRNPDFPTRRQKTDGTMTCHIGSRQSPKFPWAAAEEQGNGKAVRVFNPASTGHNKGRHLSLDP